MRLRKVVPFALRRTCVAACIGACLSVGFSSAAHADDNRKRAATEYDAGAAAFRAKDYEGAAAHFEQADVALPSAGALRQAIRARSEAGQGARAATLALLAIQRYPSDATLSRAAHDAIEKYEIVLHKLHVTCSEPCTLTVGSLVVPGAARPKWTVYLDPGKGTVTAAFDEGTVDKEIEARPGAESDLRIDRKKEPPPVVVPAVPAGPSKAEVPPDETSKDPKPDDTKDKPAEAPSKGLSPAFFAVSAAAFVGLGAATIWSGVDTINNPGQAAVRMQCQGLGTACAAYQEGLAHQQRTNVLGGDTGGVAALTIVLGIFTNWHRTPSQSSGEPSNPESPTTVSPSAIVLDRGAVFGARGTF